MEPQILNDKDQFPTNEIIFSHIGKTKKLWETLFDTIHQTYPAYTEEWRYYNDGKSWLLKILKKTKTMCWISVFDGEFRMTFYFTDKVEPLILKSDIPAELKEQFVNGKRYNKIRGLTIVFKDKKDLESAKTVLSIKNSIK
jgi:hypothetical protein